jgi:uncharacterized membrane protein (DUF106 family)
VAVTLIITLINKFAVNRKLMKEIKARMTEIRENLSKAQKEDRKEEVNKLMSEYMKINTQFMKQTFKSLFISLIVIMLFLPVLNLKYGANKDEGRERVVVAQLPFSLPVIGNQMGWLLWYFLISLSSSITFKKIIGE